MYELPSPLYVHQALSVRKPSLPTRRIPLILVIPDMASSLWGRLPSTIKPPAMIQIDKKDTNDWNYFRPLRCDSAATSTESSFPVTINSHLHYQQISGPSLFQTASTSIQWRRWCTTRARVLAPYAGS